MRIEFIKKKYRITQLSAKKKIVKHMQNTRENKILKIKTKLPKNFQIFKIGNLSKSFFFIQFPTTDYIQQLYFL